MLEVYSGGPHSVKIQSFTGRVQGLILLRSRIRADGGAVRGSVRCFQWGYHRGLRFLKMAGEEISRLWGEFDVPLYIQTFLIDAEDV